MCDCESKCENRGFNYYRYYDTPDGCDVMKKTVVTTRYGLTAGLALGTSDVLMFSQAVGFKNVLKRYMLHCLPLGLMGATFSLVANGVQALREKDDTLNYFAGGFACGPILASYVGSKHAIFLGGLALGIIGMIKKDSIEKNWCFFPEFRSHMGTVRSWRNDYTLAKDPRDDYFHTCSVNKK